MIQPKYSVIYADPPWLFRTWNARSSARWATRSGRNRRPPYACLTTRDIEQLPVAELAAADSVLFLWATYPMLPDALKVIAAWGFKYKTCAFTWVKTNPSGRGFHLGMGFWTRA